VFVVIVIVVVLMRILWFIVAILRPFSWSLQTSEIAFVVAGSP
jgi:hypothetical protein